MCSRCKQRPAVVFITRMEGNKATPEGLCLKCAKELNIAPINQMLEKMDLTDEDLENMTEEVMGLMGGGEDGEGFDPGGAATFPFLKQIFGENFGQKEAEVKEDASSEDTKGKGKKKEKPAKKRKFLNLYCTDLTAKAREGKLDRIIGRERELYRVVQILSRRSKNNPCLIGEPGVGKTAIAEGLALRIAGGEVPARLSKKEIHLLDLTSLVAGTQFRGQFESRIKGLIEEVKADGNVILFIDEVHTLVGTGDSEGSMSAANIMKPALSRGEIQVIGATTFTEYRKHIEKDTALERRFQPVTVEEPSIQDAVDVLKGVKTYYEDFHHVKISDELVRRAVLLSERYITDRFLPDKAIDLLDESCACAALRNKEAEAYHQAAMQAELLRQETEELEADVENIDYERLAVTKSELAQLDEKMKALRPAAEKAAVCDDDLAHVIELWTGIPAAKVRQSDLHRLAGMEERLGSKIIGQEEAVKLVSSAVRRSRVQISARRRPASFLFVGPTGVGKTELVKVLAAELFDTPETLIRLDMSEFMEKHSVSRIIGSPPGYVGYDEAGQLTEKVRRKPYSVLLFDEIEKAHPDVLNILLQILDDGRITDAQGRTVNFENTVIVMTSNAGSEHRENAMGFGRTAAQANRDRIMKALRDFLRPEFISRVDEVVIFGSLSLADYSRIAQLMLEELRGPLAEKGIALSWDADSVQWLAQHSHGGERGARDLRNKIRREVEDRIATLLVDRCDDPPAAIQVSVGEADGLCITAL